MGRKRPPKFDGEVRYYENPEAKSTNYWNPNRRVFFVNGIQTSASWHAKHALVLSKLQMCQVVGVFNESAVAIGEDRKPGNFLWDLLECIDDKRQWTLTAKDIVSIAHLNLCNKLSSPSDRRKLIGSILASNKAAESLFNELLDSTRPQTIFAHSQGNLIVSNALIGIGILRGKKELGRFTVHSFGSPAMTWPSGITHHQYAYAFDGVNWLSLFVNHAAFKVSTVGWPSGGGPFCHDFQEYMRDDPTFTINRFRWGAFGLTVRMDEEGLAKELVAMGSNISRIYRIFAALFCQERLDSDDVAYLYVKMIRNKKAIIEKVRKHEKLRSLLYKCLDARFTSSSEYKMMEVLAK